MIATATLLLNLVLVSWWLALRNAALRCLLIFWASSPPTVAVYWPPPAPGSRHDYRQWLQKIDKTKKLIMRKQSRTEITRLQSGKMPRFLHAPHLGSSQEVKKRTWRSYYTVHYWRVEYITSNNLKRWSLAVVLCIPFHFIRTACASLN